MLEVQNNGLVRGLTIPSYPDQTEAQPGMTQRGEQLVVLGLPDLTELVRHGNSWQCKSTTGQAALTGLPTTTAGFTVAVPVADPYAYVIDSFGSWEAVVDATQTDVTAIFAMLNKRTDTAPSGGTAETTIRSLSGVGSFGGLATTGRGMTVVDNGWFPHSTEGAQMAAAAAGANWKVNECRCRGLYLLTPGSAFSVQAVKAAAAAAAQQFFFIRFHMLRLSIQ